MRVTAHWLESTRVLRDRVAELRPLFVPPDPCQRTWYFPGELAKFDLWQPDVEIPLGFGQTARLWVIATAVVWQGAIGQRRGAKQVFFAEFHSFRLTLGSAPSCANAATPKRKGSSSGPDG